MGKLKQIGLSMREHLEDWEYVKDKIFSANERQNPLVYAGAYFTPIEDLIK